MQQLSYIKFQSKTNFDVPNTLFYKIVLGTSFFENIRHKISKKYLTFEIHCEQSKVYYIKMAGKIANLNLESFTGYF